MDRNQAIGLVLIFGILFAYFTFFAESPAPPISTKDAGKVENTTKGRSPALPASNQVAALATGFWPDSASPFQERILVLENADLQVQLSTRGARIIAATLKGYKAYNGQPLQLFTQESHALNLSLTAASGAVEVSALPFAVTTLERNRILLTATQPGTDQAIEMEYTLPAKGYQLSVRSSMLESGRPTLTKADIVWRHALKNQEKDFIQSQQAATINYLTTAVSFDNLKETALDSQSAAPAEAIRWFSHKQKFFNAGLINRAEGGFTNLSVLSYADPADATTIKQFVSKATLAGKGLSNGAAAWDMYLGPNHYKTLQTIADDYEKNVYLGWPIFRWVNKLLVVNVFNFLQQYIPNYGIIILLLVIFIRILILPLSYRSYIGMAKMRVLKPELDEIKERNGEDMQAAQQDQMKLYQQVGINPVAGCIPLLLQMPILIAMFNFFPNAIELRQQGLWWAEDLSTWDSIATLPFSIPSYGDHVSLFTILMTISTLAVTFVNNQTTAVAGPMQSISYIMPVVFMFILNSLPAGLSFYYLVSNVVSMAQQYLIKRTVDDTAIRRKLEVNKVKIAEKKPSKFATRLQDAMRMAEEAKKQEKSKKNLNQNNPNNSGNGSSKKK
jgi:YidC/Oxa1 family membrane protein insertase